MATTDGAGKIILPQTMGPRRRHLRGVPCDGGIVWLVDIPQEEFYPEGDPCPLDPASVVYRINFQPLPQVTCTCQS